MVAKFRSSDNRYRWNTRSYELRRLCFLYLLKNSWITTKQKQILMSKRFVLRMSSLNSASRVRNGCVLTGHSRFTLRITRMSRMQFKHHASNGNLVGFSRATW